MFKKISFFSILIFIFFGITVHAQIDTANCEKSIIHEVERVFASVSIDQDSLPQSCVGFLIILKEGATLKIVIRSTSIFFTNVLINNFESSFLQKAKACIVGTTIVPFFCLTYKDNWQINMQSALNLGFFKNWNQVDGKMLSPVVFGVNRVQ